MRTLRDYISPSSTPQRPLLVFFVLHDVGFVQNLESISCNGKESKMLSSAP
jgi:hypothetical protein